MNKFNIGSVVTITNVGQQYSTFTEAAREMGLVRFADGLSLWSEKDKNLVGKVTGVCFKNGRNVYGVEIRHQGRVIEVIIGERGLTNKREENMQNITANHENMDNLRHLTASVGILGGAEGVRIDAFDLGKLTSITFLDKSYKEKLTRGKRLNLLQLDQGMSVFVQGVGSINPNVPWKINHVDRENMQVSVSPLGSDFCQVEEFVSLTENNARFYRAKVKHVKQVEKKEADKPTRKVTFVYISEDGGAPQEHTISGVTGFHMNKDTVSYTSVTSAQDKFEKRVVKRSGEVPFDGLLYIEEKNPNICHKRYHLEDGKHTRTESFTL